MSWQNGSHRASGSTIIIENLEDFERISTEEIQVRSWYFRGEHLNTKFRFFPVFGGMTTNSKIGQSFPKTRGSRWGSLRLLRNVKVILFQVK